MYEASVRPTARVAQQPRQNRRQVYARFIAIPSQSANSKRAKTFVLMSVYKAATQLLLK